MRGLHAAEVERYRALKATALVLAIVLMAPGMQVLFDLAGEPRAPTAAYGALDSSSLVRGDDPFATLDRIEELASSGDAQPPGSFAAEVGFLPGARDVRVDETGSVVGYVVDGEAAGTAVALTRHMEARGWSAVSLGDVEGATFVKPDGACTWVLATCTQAGRYTSVVMRCSYGN